MAHVNDRVRALHAQFAPRMDLGTFCSQVLRPEALGYESVHQFYEPVKFAVHLTGRANNPRGSMLVSVPVHGNESNWLPTLKRRLIRMINMPHLRPEQLSFRTTYGRPLEDFAVGELPDAGRLHVHVDGKRLVLPAMPVVPMEYSSKKPAQIQRYVAQICEELPELIGDHLTPLDHVGLDEAMRIGGSLEQTVKTMLLDKAPHKNWTEFLRTHNMNSPDILDARGADTVAAAIAGQVREQLDGFLEASLQPIKAHLTAQEAARIEQRRTKGTAAQERKPLFSTPAVVSAAIGRGDLFSRIGDDLVSSPLFQHMLMDRIYLHPLPIGACRWEKDEERPRTYEPPKDVLAPGNALTASQRAAFAELQKRMVKETKDAANLIDSINVFQNSKSGLALNPQLKKDTRTAFDRLRVGSLKTYEQQKNDAESFIAALPAFDSAQFDAGVKTANKMLDALEKRTGSLTGELEDVNDAFSNFEFTLSDDEKKRAADVAFKSSVETQISAAKAFDTAAKKDFADASKKYESARSSETSLSGSALASFSAVMGTAYTSLETARASMAQNLESVEYAENLLRKNGSRDEVDKQLSTALANQRAFRVSLKNAEEDTAKAAEVVAQEKARLAAESIAKTTFRAPSGGSGAAAAPAPSDGSGPRDATAPTRDEPAAVLTDAQKKALTRQFIQDIRDGTLSRKDIINAIDKNVRTLKGDSTLAAALKNRFTDIAIDVGDNKAVILKKLDESKINASIDMHPWNALVHHTIEPATGRYPTYHRTLQTKQDMTATAPYPGDAREAMRTYHALLGVPLDPIGCHGQEHKKNKKKQQQQMDRDLPVGMEPPSDAGVPRMIPIDRAAGGRSRSRSRGRKSKGKSSRSNSPTMERAETVDSEMFLSHHLLPDTADLF